MTRIFFYHNAADRIVAAATLVSKAFAQKKPLLIYAPDHEVAAGLDRQLWTQVPNGFVPHVRGDSPLATETPIVITDSLESPLQDQRLINLSMEVPPGFSRFENLIEVVGQAEDERLAGRERVRFYKDRGYEIRYFDLGEKP